MTAAAFLLHDAMTGMRPMTAAAMCANLPGVWHGC